MEAIAVPSDSLVEASGRDAKATVYRRLLERADPLSARYLTAILGGELRIGLREGHLEKGIAQAFDRELAAVARYHQQSPESPGMVRSVTTAATPSAPPSSSARARSGLSKTRAS